jgi:hypothetical protein
MKPRGVVVLAIGALATALTLAALIVFLPGLNRACPAIGYAYVGDVELAFSAEPASAAACFGQGCAPETVTPRDGKWLVPQTSPYLVPPASATSVYVGAVTPAGNRIAVTRAIEGESTGERPYGPHCPGPSKFKPVQVVLD